LSEAPTVTILYHADCIDGFGAAFAAWRRFGSTAIYRPLHHGEAWEVTEISGHDVFVLDFSFAPDVLETMAAQAKSVTQIDHHASARQAWADKLATVDHGLAQYSHPELPLTVIFDMEKSGARLAWEYFQPDRPIPRALQHIEDQDLWRFALPGTRAFCRALRLQGFDFATWDELVKQTPSADSARYREMLASGDAIEIFFQKEVERLANGPLRMAARLRGEPVDALQAMRHGQAILADGDRAWLAISGVAINANALFASELGNLLAEQSGSFGLIWQLAGDGEIKASLRSKGSFDVAAIAVRYGGGGHRNAAGFRMPLTQFMTEILGKSLA
jgi:oligoribonuclease NrnB/cAMP/cGMP phosphodiesterase (DHH superfamily)